MTTLRGFLLLSFLFLNSSFAGDKLTIERVNEIIAKEHDDKEMTKAMKIYPKARSYDVKIKVEPADGEIVEFETKAVERHVEGKFVVSDAISPEGEVAFSMVVEFHAESKTYRKYIVADGKLKNYMVATRISGTRTLSWVDLSEEKYAAKRDSLVVESHTDTTTTWRVIYFENGKIQYVETGVATVVE